MAEEVEHKTKKQRTEDKYRLFYWPGIPGRGEPIRLAFEEAGVDYEDVAYTEGVKAVTGLLSASSKHPPHFAPPILQHGDLEISQLPNIVFYLGPKLKLVPEKEHDYFRVNQFFLTAADLLCEAHDTHHPIATSLYYEDQKESAALRAKDFRENRIPKFFKHFESALDYNKGSNHEWLVGDRLTYADLMLFHVVDGLLFAFPRCLETLKESDKYPKVFDLYKRVRERTNISEYLASKRRQPFSNGLFRYYEELDEPPAEEE